MQKLLLFCFGDSRNQVFQSFQTFDEFHFLNAKRDVINNSYYDILRMSFDFNSTFFEILLSIKPIFKHGRCVFELIAVFDDLAILTNKPSLCKNMLEIVLYFFILVDQ